MGRPNNQGVTALAAKAKSKAPSIVSARAQHEQAARLPANEVCDFELYSLLVRKQLIPGSAKKTAAQTSTQGGHPLSPRDNIVKSESQRHDTLRKNGCLFRSPRTLLRNRSCAKTAVFSQDQNTSCLNPNVTPGGLRGRSHCLFDWLDGCFFRRPRSLLGVESPNILISDVICDQPPPTTPPTTSH